MTKLYKGIAFSPPTRLTQPVNAADTEFHVENASALPDAPNYATLGTDEEGETILYAAKADGLLSGCTRAVEGTAKAWPADTPIARNFTAADYNSVIDRIEEKVDAQEGKGLSSNDFTDTEKEKLAGLENYDDSALAARMTAAEEKNAEQDTVLAGKVDAAQGMALYPDSDKAKLAGIAEGANKYTLPAASAEALGGIKLGKGLSIDENGTVSVTGGGGGGESFLERVTSFLPDGSIRETTDGTVTMTRFLPDGSIEVSVLDESGEAVSTKKTTFLPGGEIKEVSI